MDTRELVLGFYNQDLEAESGFIHIHWVKQHAITRAGCNTAAYILPTSQTLDLAVVERAHLSGCSFGNCVRRVRPVKRKKECKRWECQDAGGPLTQTGRKMKKCSSWRRCGEVRLWVRLEGRQRDVSWPVASEARRQKRKHWRVSGCGILHQTPSRLEDCMTELPFIALLVVQQCQASREQSHVKTRLLAAVGVIPVWRPTAWLYAASASLGQTWSSSCVFSSVPPSACVTLKGGFLTNNLTSLEQRCKRSSQTSSLYVPFTRCTSSASCHLLRPDMPTNRNQLLKTSLCKTPWFISHSPSWGKDLREGEEETEKGPHSKC